MGYYRGSYYRGSYYRGGIFSSIGKFVKGAAGVVSKLGIPGISTVAGVVAGIGGRPAIAPSMSLVAPPGGPMGFPEPGITGTVHRIAPGGHPGYGRMTKDGRFTERRRPRMQVTNTRALKRAGRRIKGFLRIASRLGALPVNRGKGKLFKRKRGR